MPSATPPKKQDTPWPEDRAHEQDDRLLPWVQADAGDSRHWQHERRLAKREAISGQNKTTDDVDDVVLVRSNGDRPMRKNQSIAANKKTPRRFRVEIDQSNSSAACNDGED